MRIKIITFFIFIFIVVMHFLIGHKLAPDALTSGTILVVNVLIVYVGYKIYEELPKIHFIVLVLSYLALFFLFMKTLVNAEALFLLSVLGLAATIRNFKLLAYFWALVISFTFCQPYAWQSVLLFFFFLKIVFSIKNYDLSSTLLIFLISGLLIFFFVIFPILVLITQEDFRSIYNILKNKQVLEAIYTTFITSTISTIIMIIFFIPLSYALSRLEFTGKTFLLSLIDLPIIIPQSAAGIALLQVFGRNQYIGELLYNLFGLRFDGTIVGICLAQIFVAMPFIIKTSLAAFDSIPVSLEQNAKTLGSNSFDTFKRISLPLASKGIIIGIIISWARAAGEFGAVFFLSPYPETAPVSIYNRFTSIGLTQTTPLVATLLLFSILIFFLLQFVVRSMPSMYSKEIL
ncbi:ABC transporter permease subunit [bacterium]